MKKKRAKSKPMPVHQCEISLGALRPMDWPKKLDAKRILRNMATHCARYYNEADRCGDVMFQGGYYRAFWLANQLSLELEGMHRPFSELGLIGAVIEQEKIPCSDVNG